MSILRIYVSATEGKPIQWARLTGSGQIVSRGHEAQLALHEDDTDVELIVPAEQVLFITPPLSSKQRARLTENNLSWLAEPFLAQEVERVHVVSGTPLDEHCLPLCVIEHAWLAGIITRLGEKQLRPTRIVAESQLNDWTEGIWNICLKAGGGFARTGLAQGFLLDQTGNDQPPQVLRLAIKESAPAAIDLYWEESCMAPDKSLWQELLGVPVRLKGVWQWTDPIPDTCIDLACGPHSPSGHGQNLLRRLKPLLWLAAGIMAINLGGLLLSNGLGYREKTRLNGEIEEQLRKVFPQTTAILDPVRQMRQNLERLRQDTGAPSGNDFLPLLESASTALSKVSGNIHALQYESGSLIVELSTIDAARLARLQEEINSAGLRASKDTPAGNPGMVRIRVSRSS